jgi:hypothetical protein
MYEKNGIFPRSKHCTQRLEKEKQASSIFSGSPGLVYLPTTWFMVFPDRTPAFISGVQLGAWKHSTRLIHEQKTTRLTRASIIFWKIPKRYSDACTLVFGSTGVKPSETAQRLLHAILVPAVAWGPNLFLEKTHRLT